MTIPRPGEDSQAGAASFLEFYLRHPRYQSKLAVRDHLLTGGESFRDDCLPIRTAIENHRTGLNRHVRLDHKNELALLTVLQGLRRHHDGVGLLGQGQYHVHKLARPQPPVSVRKLSLQLDGAGGLVHRVVDET